MIRFMRSVVDKVGRLIEFGTGERSAKTKVKEAKSNPTNVQAGKAAGEASLDIFSASFELPTRARATTRTHVWNYSCSDCSTQCDPTIIRSSVYDGRQQSVLQLTVPISRISTRLGSFGNGSLTSGKPEIRTAERLHHQPNPKKHTKTIQHSCSNTQQPCNRSRIA